MRDVPPSPLFVEEEERADSHEQTIHAVLLSAPAADSRDELQSDVARTREARQSMEYQQ
jgi:hypothetical protein